MAPILGQLLPAIIDPKHPVRRYGLIRYGPFILLAFALSACGDPEVDTVAPGQLTGDSGTATTPGTDPNTGQSAYCAELPNPDGKAATETGGVCHRPKGGETITYTLVVPPSPTARYRITLDALWTAADFPTNFPNDAHFSPLVGTTHNEQVVFWEVDGQPATIGIESMAESGSTSNLSNEISAAESNGYSQGAFVGPDIDSGDGEASMEFDVTTDYPLATFVSMVAPSPDWFVGVSGFSLLDDTGYWKSYEEISLKVYDAGTDRGPRPKSPNQDSSADNLPITLLSSDRDDTDFENGVHFQTGDVIATFIFEKLEP